MFEHPFSLLTAKLTFSPGQSNQSQAQPDNKGGSMSEGREDVAFLVVEEQRRVEGREVDDGQWGIDHRQYKIG